MSDVARDWLNLLAFFLWARFMARVYPDPHTWIPGQFKIRAPKIPSKKRANTLKR